MLSSALMILLWLVPLSALASHSTLPQEPPRQLSAEARRAVEARGAELVEAIHAADGATGRETLLRICAPSFVERAGVDRVVGQLARIGADFGPLEFHHAELAEGVRGGDVWRVLHVFVKSAKTGRWHDLQVRVDPMPPDLLEEIAFIAEVSEPVYVPNGDLTDPATSEWLDGYVDRLAEKEQLSGCILLALGGEVVFERYFGFADAARAIPVTPETRFNLGSGNKMFTALAVVLLAREGRLRLEDPIGPYFEDFPDPEAAKRITIAHLLSHTSGLGEYWTQETSQAVRAAGSARDLLPLVYRAGVQFEAGERYEYSNSNFVLAGLIVEAVGGKPYDAFVRERITGPLELKDTDTFPMDGSAPRLAERLIRDGTAWKAAPLAKRGGPAGGGFSTARDMLAFASALAAGKVVPLDDLERMTSSQTPAATRDPIDDYGFGFILRRLGRIASYGHGGIAPGVNFELAVYPAIRGTLIAFCNQDNGAYDDLRRTAEKLLTGAR